MSRLAALPILCAFLAACNGVFFFPDRYLYSTPDQIGVAYEERVLDDGAGPKLMTWLLTAENSKGLIVHLHGNAENMSSHIGSVYWLPARGYDVLLADYRGYGGSAGEPSMQGINEDAERIFRFGKKIADARGEPLILFGQSLGGALGIRAAARPEFSGIFRRIVIESAFSDYRGIAREKIGGNFFTRMLGYPFLFTITETYSPLPFVPELKTGSLLFVHSESDATVSIGHSEELFTAAPEPKQFWRVPGSSHSGAFRDPVLREKLLVFLESGT